MRKGVDGVRAIVEGRAPSRSVRRSPLRLRREDEGQGEDPFLGPLGFVLYVKRLEQGPFQLPVIDARRKHVELEPAQLAMLLDGIDLNARRLARWYPEESKGIDIDLGV